MPKPGETTWTAGKLDELRGHWKAGLSCLVIAQRMRTTKNAVAGAAHRLGLERRPSPIKPRVTDERQGVKRLAPGASTLPPLASQQ